jgi:hypothetical protein
MNHRSPREIATAVMVTIGLLAAWYAIVWSTVKIARLAWTH